MGGFDATGTVQQVLGAVQVTVALDGVPEAEIWLARLKTEADRAREDLAGRSPQARQLADARDRVQRIDEQLEEAARPPRPEDSPQPEPASVALTIFNCEGY